MEFLHLEVATKKTFNITFKAATSFVDAEDDQQLKKPPTEVFGWAKNSSAVLLSDNWTCGWSRSRGRCRPLTGNGKKEGIDTQLASVWIG